MACWNGARDKLPAAEQKDLREQVLVARGSAKEKRLSTTEIDAEAEQVLQERLKSSPVTTADLPEVRETDPRAGQGGAASRAAGLYSRAVAD